ncbi:MAG: class I SAM-dependent methyltransferase [Candidatus Hydrogenedentales bacterium]|jgi:phosphatidylethanolamine/phosphatidyl-N-methylethanolamine N-methyltransferase
MGFSGNGNIWRNAWGFFRQFVAHPKEVGAFAASSRYLAAAVTDAAGVQDADVVVEFGAGTGTISRVVVTRLRADATFFSLEINPDFVEVCRKCLPGLEIIEGSAVDTPRYLKEHGKDFCDSIVSGLPWAAFDETLQDRLLDATLNALRPGGKFATYMYLSSMALPAGRRFRRKLADRFSKVEKSQVCWKNLPPAIVLYGEK